MNRYLKLALSSAVLISTMASCGDEPVASAAEQGDTAQTAPSTTIKQSNDDSDPANDTPDPELKPSDTSQTTELANGTLPKHLQTRTSAIEGTWKVVEIRVDDMLLGLARQNPSITFSADGKISGNTGCNSMFGTYVADGKGGIKIDPVGTTKMYCSGLEVNESTFLSILQHAVIVESSANQLKLLTEPTASPLGAGTSQNWIVATRS